MGEGIVTPDRPVISTNILIGGAAAAGQSPGSVFKVFTFLSKYRINAAAPEGRRGGGSGTCIGKIYASTSRSYPRISSWGRRSGGAKPRERQQGIQNISSLKRMVPPPPKGAPAAFSDLILENLLINSPLISTDIPSGVAAAAGRSPGSVRLMAGVLFSFK